MLLVKRVEHTENSYHIQFQFAYSRRLWQQGPTSDIKERNPIHTMNVIPSVWRIFQEAELGFGFETMPYQRIKANIVQWGDETRKGTICFALKQCRYQKTSMPCWLHCFHWKLKMFSTFGFSWQWQWFRGHLYIQAIYIF